MKKLFTLSCMILLSGCIHANNISISNLNLTGKNTTEHFALVQFDISWENSWRTSAAPNNWDAAWVFIKYRVGTGNWQHAWLNDAGHTAPAGSAIDVGLLTPGAAFNAASNPGLGAFIYRDADGAGTFSNTGIQLRWNYGDNGLADNDRAEIRVFAIEMVNVPQESFYLGSGGYETNSFTDGSWTYGASIPYLISSENAITIEPSPGNLWFTSPSLPTDNSNDDPIILGADYPKGYNAFYCMKYEISQQGYVDFLNCLTATQAGSRYSASSRPRYGITLTGSIYSTTLPFVACDLLSWADLTAYLDWSCLRPMTELEFEKACRGTNPVVANEYAWGSTNINPAEGILNSGSSDELALNYGSNACYFNTSSTLGPLRVGVFASSEASRKLTGATNYGMMEMSGSLYEYTARELAGATYYGIMEMSGNLYEHPVTAGNAAGRLFLGNNGNGALLVNGDADGLTWPGADAVGAGIRGGGWNSLDMYLQVSDRGMAVNSFSGRDDEFGGRGVRTLPPPPPPFNCGTSAIIIHHVAGEVAPVTKTVTYGTVTNIPGETSKCWITSNLGADRQATSFDDASEASGGWYWQYNRKQGYKHDGSTRTPNTTWVNSNTEDQEWEVANDPCALELGNGWRLPTYTEWSNVDAADGNWTTWIGPWNSALKLHAAGFLNTTGVLEYRGEIGYYLSSTQTTDPLGGWILGFSYSNCQLYPGGDKANGWATRCIKELVGD